MTVVLMKNTPIGRRAYAISREVADKMVDAGEAVQDKVHAGIYEEVTPGEREQGYMTRTMTPLDPVAVRKKPASKSRSRVEEASDEE